MSQLGGCTMSSIAYTFHFLDHSLTATDWRWQGHCRKMPLFIIILVWGEIVYVLVWVTVLKMLSDEQSGLSSSSLTDNSSSWVIPFWERCSFIQCIPSKTLKFCDSEHATLLPSQVYHNTLIYAMFSIPCGKGHSQGHAVVMGLTLPYQNNF